MLFSRKKTAPTTDTVKITTETQIKETPSKSDTVIEVIKATTKSLSETIDKHNEINRGFIRWSCMNNKLIFLLKNSDDYVSGEEISKIFGITRASVWKHIKVLKNWWIVTMK